MGALHVIRALWNVRDFRQSATFRMFRCATAPAAVGVGSVRKRYRRDGLSCHCKLDGILNRPSEEGNRRDLHALANPEKPSHLISSTLRPKVGAAKPPFPSKRLLPNPSIKRHRQFVVLLQQRRNASTCAPDSGSLVPSSKSGPSSKPFSGPPASRSWASAPVQGMELLTLAARRMLIRPESSFAAGRTPGM